MTWKLSPWIFQKLRGEVYRTTFSQRNNMDDLSDNNIKLIKYALKKLAESTDPKSENYEHILLDIHRITYKLDNHSQLTGTDAERPVLLN